MGVVHTQESAYGKEMWKWDHTTAEVHPTTRERGMRPTEFCEYPKMLYKAQRTDKGVKPTDLMPVNSLIEQRNMESRGYHESQQDALDAFHAGEMALAKAHAERNFSEQRMSPQAKAEVSAFEAQAEGMVGEMPEQPRKRRGRPRKVQE